MTSTNYEIERQTGLVAHLKYEYQNAAKEVAKAEAVLQFKRKEYDKAFQQLVSLQLRNI